MGTSQSKLLSKWPVGVGLALPLVLETRSLAKRVGQTLPLQAMFIRGGPPKAHDVSQLSDIRLLAPNGGFVPHFRGARSFVIMQIGGFVFQKAFSFRLSAIRRSRTVEGPRSSSQEPVPGPPTPQPSTFDLELLFGFVPHFRRARSFVIMQIGGFVFQKALSFQPSAIRRSRTVEG